MIPDFSLPQFEASNASFLQGEQIISTLLYHIEHAQSKIWSSIFILSLDTSIPNVHRVKELFDALIRAHDRGVDVRLVAGNFNSDYYDFNVNLQALTYLEERGINVKLFKSEYRSENHCKDWIFDDSLQITGSANLTIGGLFSNTETFIEVQSLDLNKVLSQRFNFIWESSQNIQSISSWEE